MLLDPRDHSATVPESMVYTRWYFDLDSIVLQARSHFTNARHRSRVGEIGPERCRDPNISYKLRLSRYCPRNVELSNDATDTLTSIIALSVVVIHGPLSTVLQGASILRCSRYINSGPQGGVWWEGS